MRAAVFDVWLLRFQLKIATEKPNCQVVLLLDHAPRWGIVASAWSEVKEKSIRNCFAHVDIFQKEQRDALRESQDRARDFDVTVAIDSLRSSFLTRAASEETEEFDAESASLCDEQDPGLNPAQSSFASDEEVLALLKVLDGSHSVCKHIDSMLKERQFMEFFVPEDETNMASAFMETGQSPEDESMDDDDYEPSASSEYHIEDDNGQKLSPVKKVLKTRGKEYASYRTDRLASPGEMDLDDDWVAEDTVVLDPSIDLQDPYILMDAAAALRLLGHDGIEQCFSFNLVPGSVLRFGHDLILDSGSSLIFIFVSGTATATSVFIFITTATKYEAACVSFSSILVFVAGPASTFVLTFVTTAAKYGTVDASPSSTFVFVTFVLTFITTATKYEAADASPSSILDFVAIWL
ncbi:hypothetical protein BCR41DRAFT_385211 [Lobosporangium transversale]|uniref:Uncharacterized protein n=1 Tax=Lobosporangium transversale TaxID=64571 RepID=A0A1Y2GTT2_9FUNG|nr:hypothetical protein BCR41DRAFT_385211 [Lobosporangium transversale]ORZ21759.1 hypothetical protein BCR41DRAFT_385211 [Lobosporangium transversale]|eukprot:XP_021883010.1 hypothetical protein BCR41DRAFT_385211 [Lobosporangium transversale]